MNIARACWEEIILANENLTWVILVTQDNLCIHKHNIYYPRGGTQAMKNSIPSISVPVININLHCSGEITNKSNRTASQYLKWSADSLNFLKRSEYDSSLVSLQSQSKITPAPAAASVQLTAGIILTTTVTQLPVSTAHGTSSVSFKHLRSRETSLRDALKVQLSKSIDSYQFTCYGHKYKCTGSQNAPKNLKHIIYYI